MDLHFGSDALHFREELRGWLAQNLDHPFSEDVRNPDNDEDALVEIRRSFQRKLNELTARMLGNTGEDNEAARTARRLFIE